MGDINRTSTAINEAMDKTIDNDPAVLVWGWDDLVGSITGIQLEETKGKVDMDWDENAFIFQRNGDTGAKKDRIQFNLQKLHSIRVDGEMRLHIHWEQTTTDAIEWAVQYRIQNNGEDKETSWGSIYTAYSGATADTSNNAFDYTGGTMNQITSICVVPLADASISSTIQFRLARTDSNDYNVLATFVDAHVQYDQIGSRSEFVK